MRTLDGQEVITRPLLDGDGNEQAEHNHHKVSRLQLLLLVPICDSCAAGCGSTGRGRLAIEASTARALASSFDWLDRMPPACHRHLHAGT